MHTCVAVPRWVPTLKSVATDPLLLPLPVLLSPLTTSMEMDTFFSFPFPRDEATTKSTNTEKVPMLMRDSFKMATQIFSRLDDVDGDDDGDAPSCQSYANETENTPPVGLTRLTTIQAGDVFGDNSLNLKQQFSDMAFIDAVMSPSIVIPRAIGTEHNAVNQDLLAPPIFIKSASVSQMSDSDETLSPPLSECESHMRMRMILDVAKPFVNANEATPYLPTPTTSNTNTSTYNHNNTGTVPNITEILPPKPALTRLFPKVAHPQTKTKSADSTDNSMAASSTDAGSSDFDVDVDVDFDIDNSHTAICNSRPCLRSRRATRRNLRVSQSVTFRKLVKVNTVGETGLRAARPSSCEDLAELSRPRPTALNRPRPRPTALPADTGLDRRRKQERCQDTRNHNRKKWNLRSATRSTASGVKKTLHRTPSKHEVATRMAKAPVKLTRETLTPARFVLESALEWTSWRACILPRPPNKSWTASTTGHTGFTNRDLFRTPRSDQSSIGRPTMYEVAVQTPNSVRKHVVFYKVANSARLSVCFEKFLLRRQRSLVAQVEGVICQNCKVYVRRGILNRRFVLPAGEAKIHITSARHLRAIARVRLDYAWHQKRTLQRGGYVISRDLL